MLVHAAGESYKEPPNQRGSPVYAVVLAVDSERELEKLEHKLRMREISHSAFREPDPPYNGELMAIGIEPQDRANLKSLLKNYPTLK